LRKEKEINGAGTGEIVYNETGNISIYYIKKQEYAYIDGI